VTEQLLAIGADGARGGWLAVACSSETPDPADIESRRTTVSLCATFAELIGPRTGAGVPVAVDMPMGLLDSVDFRLCDAEARNLLGAAATASSRRRHGRYWRPRRIPTPVPWSKSSARLSPRRRA
jgi:predicted RNase H-like nuclease